MRKAFSDQMRFDCRGVLQVQLNLNCRDEIIPILRTLQHIYSQAEDRDRILDLIAQDVNRGTRDDLGREGLDFWQVLVLAAVRLGCNLNYDKLQDLAEQHRALRHVMGIGDWDEDANFSWRRIRDNVCLLAPATIEQISHLIVAAGHRLEPEAVKQVRADAFVVETNIHYPSESSLILDGVRLILQLCVQLATLFGLSGWRQHRQLFKRIKAIARRIQRISSRKGPNYQQRLKKEYRQLLRRTHMILRQAEQLRVDLGKRKLNDAARLQLDKLETFLSRTQQVCDTARRRVVHNETVPNEEKLFSMFEPHTQLYKRGKAGKPVQFGRLAMIYEDAAGFVVHHFMLPRDVHDRDVAVEQTRLVQDRLQGRIEELSFDRGFHSPENQKQLAEIVEGLCLPKPGAKQAATQRDRAGVKFHAAQQRHPGVESAIGALQAGNGLKRCRDRSELGFDRYLALGILGRNLHVLGKLLIARESKQAEAARSKRQPIAA